MFAAPLQSYLAGQQLSNDGTTPNSVIDISAGLATDTTNAFGIVLPAFKKSIASTWAAGTGNGGRGTGVSLTASTWYHVYSIINGGAPDAYIDTSASGANAPAGTTAFRRVGSVLTDASSHILAFTQNGDEFLWKAPVNILNGTTTSATASSLTMTTPLGIECWAKFTALLTFSAGFTGSVFYALDMGTQVAESVSGYENLAVITASTRAAGDFTFRTNTSSQIGLVSTGTGATISVASYGYIDRRGRDT